VIRAKVRQHTKINKFITILDDRQWGYEEKKLP
jgi:hypothetical protein